MEDGTSIGMHIVCQEVYLCYVIFILTTLSLTLLSLFFRLGNSKRLNSLSKLPQLVSGITSTYFTHMLGTKQKATNNQTREFTDIEGKGVGRFKRVEGSNNT